MTYSTREEAVASVADDACRVQYDEGDPDRIKDMAATFTHHAVELIESLGNYVSETTAEVDEDADSRMRYARRELIEKWATAQLAISKVAFVMRVDGQTAYDRLIAALNIEGGNIDMSGL
jgi:hypothetical protein